MQIFKKMVYPFVFLLSTTLSSQIFFSEYAEGSSYNKYLEIYNHTSNTIDLSNYAFPSCSNGCDIDGEWDYMNYFPEGSVIEPSDVYVITHPFATDPLNEYYTSEIAMYSDHQFSYLSNGDDVFALIEIESGVIVDILGNVGPDPGDGWDVAGVVNATKDHTLVRKSSVLNGNSGNWSASAGINSDDSEWIVFDNETWSNLGFHNYDNNPSSDIFGCTCEDASNYMSLATIDDGSCVIDGECSDDSALNYTVVLCEDVTFINEDCQYDPIDVSGCTIDTFACNYFDWDYQVTASNMTIAITDVENLVSGDILGVFFVDENGYLHCGGSVNFDGDQTAISAWANDNTSSQLDGFTTGDELLFLLYREGDVYEVNVTMSQDTPFVDTFSQNGFGQITALTLGDEFNQSCIYAPLGVDCDGNMITEIIENGFLNKNVIKSIDFLGRPFNNRSVLVNQPHIILYDSGQYEKRYFSHH